MSVDLGVWYARTPLTPEEAARKYLAWCAGEASSGEVDLGGGLTLTADLVLGGDPAPAGDTASTSGLAWTDEKAAQAGAGGPVAEVIAFYDALTDEFPDLPDGDYRTSPWATPLTVGDEFVVMSIVFPRAAEVCRTVLRLAADHDLVCFDLHPDELFFGRPSSS
ncbi:hypothetical protein [Sphaerisporangium dianthi]|uniref:Uncharacterized protein n=1 Tax=Sphaerisporangium dianthi TaxID=1436120 RepID=A0ABV9C9Q7_9ACTN